MERVPLNSSGLFTATLDTDNNVLTNISLAVNGMLGSELRNFGPNSTGFTFQRDSLSILDEDQGAFFGLGIHPGNDVIVDRLLSESFILVHSTKDIFTNTVHPPQFPDGFPFGELRGEVAVVPVPGAVWLFGSGFIGLAGLA